MNNFNLEDITRSYLVDSYVPEVSTIFEEKEFQNQKISKEQQAAFFLSGMYLPMQVYEQQSKLISAELEKNNIDKNSVNDYLNLVSATKTYLSKNDKVIENLSKKVEGKGLESLIETGNFEEAKSILDSFKYESIRETFENIEDYLSHIELGVNSQYQNIMAAAQLKGIQGENLTQIEVESINYLQKFADVLVEEAQKIYGVTIQTNQNNNNNQKKAA